MNRPEYLAELWQHLSPLPISREDANDAIRFYEEFFDEAGPEREQAVIAELGSPAYVAAQIALKLSYSATPLNGGGERKPGIRKRASALWLVILGILSAPVTLPLAGGVVIVIISLLISAFAIVMAFGVSGVALMAGGAYLAVHSIFTVFSIGLATAVYFTGAGLVMLGGGGMLAVVGWKIGKFFIKIAAKTGSRFFNRRKSGETAEFVPAAPAAGSQMGNGNDSRITEG